LFTLFALGFSCVMTQLALMRELLAAFSGNEMVLGVVLGLWLLLMGMGAWLGGLSARLPHSPVALAALLVATAILPPIQIFLARALRNVVFVHGAAVGVIETLGASFVLLLPYCLAAGCALSLGCAILSRNQGALGTGRGYVADSAGSLAGGLLFSLVLVRSWDHIAILVCPALLSLAAAVVLHRKLCLPAGGLALALLAAVVFLDPDGLSTRLQYPRQRLVERANSPYGKLLLVQSEGQLDFIENGVPLISTRDDARLEETVHYALAQRPDARRVLLVSGGISGTAREILKYPVSRVDYVELDPLILDLGQKHLPGNLADPRIHLFNADGRVFIKQAAARLAHGAGRMRGAGAEIRNPKSEVRSLESEFRSPRSEVGDGYDVIILDLPAPATAQLNRFYTAEFLAEAKQALAANGVVSFSLGQYENYVSRDLARLLASAQRTVRTSFKNTLAIPGGRVFFLASDGPLFSDIASRLEQRKIQTRLVNRHYLDAMLAPDRMADLARAMAEPAASNRDFSPVLYFYHLRHWMSQFNLRFGPLQAVLLAVLGLYLVRLRRSAFVLFASGFAASALETVLLLAFQVLCGSVYHQVGLIVTVFMLGLAVGAWWINRAFARQSPEAPQLQRKPQPARLLRLLAVAVAAYALCLPLILPGLGRLGGTAVELLAIKAAIGGLTFLLAALVGIQFPLANQLEAAAPAALSRLYTADFVGASLGALLACTLLIPLLGMPGVCLLTAALNALAAAAMWGGKPRS
jgi:spermidine synthase